MDEQEDLRSPDLATRAAAAERLAQMGSDAADATIELLHACGDEAEVCDWAVAALEELGPPPVEMIESIAPLVSSNAPITAYWALTLLGRSGPNANHCQDQVAATLTASADSSVQEKAAWCLGKVGATSKSATAALAQAAKSTNVRLARLAKESMAAAAQ